SFDALLAVKAHDFLKVDGNSGFAALAHYQKNAADWIFGYLSYDLKNEVEQLGSDNFDGLAFPQLYFFRPQKIIAIKGNRAHFLYLQEQRDDIQDDFTAI